jgi:predicted Zn-dependent protease
MQLGPLAETSLDRLGTLVEQALTWEPLNPYCWMLWADWFAARHRRDAREWVLREMARLFPDNEPARVELARLLIGRGAEHWDEAEGWLRQVIKQHPSDEHSRVELARLLIGRGAEHWDEAEGWLRQVIEQHPSHEHSRVELARLLIRRGAEHWDEAERWLRAVIDDDPSHEPSQRSTGWPAVAVRQKRRSDQAAHRGPRPQPGQPDRATSA